MIKNKKSRIEKIFEREEKKKGPKVGIFFLIDNIIFNYYENTCECENIDGMISVNCTFEKYFNELTYIFNSKLDKDYAYYPKGKVIYYVNNNVYHIYLDKSLDNEDIKNEIKEKFKLEKENIDWIFN